LLQLFVLHNINIIKRFEDQKYGISLKEFEKRGWLDSWMDEYFPPDEVLTFEAYSVKDLENLYK
jgi:hypothetical protein